MNEAPPLSRPTESPQQLVTRMAREVEMLAVSGIAPDQFLPQFLLRVVTAVGAPAGAIWLLQRGQLQLGCGVNLETIGLTNVIADQSAHKKLLSDIAANIQTKAVPTDDDSLLTFPERFLLIMAAVQSSGTCRAIIEIFQRPDVPEAARSGYMEFVEQMAGYASLYLDRSKKPTPAVAAGLSEPLARFGLQLQRSLDVTAVATIAANEGRTLVACDRISVLIQRGKRITVQAVSGQESVHPRANLVQSMVNLSREVIQSGVPVKYTGSMELLAPQLEERLADFVQESGARLVYVLPLRQSLLLETTTPENHRPQEPGRVFGCVVLEHFAQSEPSALLNERVDWFTAYASAALDTARKHQSLFLLPLWQFLGQMTEWLQGRKLIKTLMALVMLAALLAMLALVRVDHRIEGQGRLMPVVRREIFVPLDGEVVDVLVTSGQHVVKGDLLVRLRNNELRTELITTESQMQEKRKLLSALLAERDEAIRQQSSERTYRIEGDLARTRIELQGLALQLVVLKEREELLNVTAPISGTVSTFDVEQNLRQRPVRRGDILLEVMDDTGPWELELDVAEHRMGHLLRARHNSDSALPVDFLLVTAPEQTHHATLNQVATRSVISSEGQPVVPVRAGLSDGEVVSRRIGAEVRAKLHCGRTSVGYVLFGELIEFLQRALWF
ncbi:MAG: biotin/lipoyl-binding protein [Planctomycetota bacterium]